MKALLTLALLFVPAVSQAKLKVVTTTTDFADLARQVGGEFVEVHSVAKGPENVHNVLAAPTEMLKLNAADLFVHAGLDAEPWRDNLLRGARNPRVNPGRPGNVDLSAGVELRDVPAGRVDRSQGDVHALGNPHYPLSLAAGQRMAVTLAKAMAAADPPNAAAYRENAAKLVTDLGRLRDELRQRFAPHAGLKIVTFHPAWAYLADTLPVEIAGTIEPQPAVTPSPQQVRDLVERMRRDDVRVVVVETYSDDNLAARVAEQAGARLVKLPDHVNGLPDVRSYQELFRYATAKLIEAAEAAPKAR